MTRAAEMAADWWTERLMRGDKAAFRAALLPLIEAEIARIGECWLQCDYDPDEILLQAVHAAGLECRGMMFSARGILPTKHQLRVYPDRLRPKEGYGNWVDDIPVPPAQTAQPVDGTDE